MAPGQRLASPTYASRATRFARKWTDPASVKEALDDVGGGHNVQIARASNFPKDEGKRLDEIARAAGTFPRVLGRFVRDEQWLSLPEAIRKMTSLPASRLGLADRGVIRADMKADLVLFDPATILDLSTFDEPQTLARGVHTVFVNGVAVWAEGRATGATPGRVLTR